jgi:hypothetical protein
VNIEAKKRVETYHPRESALAAVGGPRRLIRINVVQTTFGLRSSRPFRSVGRLIRLALRGWCAQTWLGAHLKKRIWCLNKSTELDFRGNIFFFGKMREHCVVGSPREKKNQGPGPELNESPSPLYIRAQAPNLEPSLSSGFGLSFFHPSIHPSRDLTLSWTLDVVDKQTQADRRTRPRRWSSRRTQEKTQGETPLSPLSPSGTQPPPSLRPVGWGRQRAAAKASAQGSGEWVADVIFVFILVCVLVCLVCPSVRWC